MNDKDKSPHRDLERFQLGGLLGEGADMQVFAATDVESGLPCVVKRPHPSLISRNIHDDVERRMSLQAELRSEGGVWAGLPGLLTVTAPDAFGWYFGDDLSNSYAVQVEERAVGIPLLGSVADQVRGHPVGLPLNLFILHPSTMHIERCIENPTLTVLRIIEQCLELGLLAGDLGPRNLFYSPGTGRATVIDLGALRRPEPKSARSPEFDLNNILFEFFQFYTTPAEHPTSSDDYTRVSEHRLVGSLERMVQSMVEKYSALTNSQQRDSAQTILTGLAERRYQSVGEFRTDFEVYLEEAVREPPSEYVNGAWSTAVERLREPYWTKYLFHADSELANYT